MNKQIQLKILLFFVLFSLVSLLPILANAAQFQSGVTIIPPTNPTGGNPTTNQSANPTGGSPTPNPPVATCGLQILSGVPINYGQLYPTQDSADQIVTYKNIGNATGEVGVKGSHWLGGTTANPLYYQGVEMTHVANAPGLYWEQKLPIDVKITLGQLDPGLIGHAYFQVHIPHGALTTSFHQEVTLELLC